MAASTIKPLRCNDLLFINEYLRNGRNGVQAYRVVHPKTSYHVAGQRASVVLKRVAVQAEIAQRIQHEAGITRDFIETGLLHHYQLANERQDYVAGASILMDCAKLAGFLVDKRADVTPLEAPSQFESRLRTILDIPVADADAA